MHKNICLLIPDITKDSKELVFFEKLISTLKPETWMVFTDNIKIPISNKIPVLHTFYFRHLFFKKLIFTNTKTIQTIDHVSKYGTCIALDTNNAYISNNTEKFLEYLIGEKLW